ncbi:unnamed protein product [Dracunculus medinensis]|uniref:Vesicle transport protein n=1 Tax=Dracunculus medinensis TaxID=318479 RepID=A0A0N4UAK7_DRAME|nr:unnamed protein product [Dracunculus medinensis]
MSDVYLFIYLHFFLKEFSPLLVKPAPLACRIRQYARESFGDRNTCESPINETSLSFDLRLMCFIGLLILSLICSFSGNALLFTGRVTGFCVMVSLGSILSLVGKFIKISLFFFLFFISFCFYFRTFFLMGPVKQLKKMFEHGRFIASLLYLISIFLTLFAGLILSNALLAFLLVIFQYLAMIWYSLSYIPMAQYAFLSNFLLNFRDFKVVLNLKMRC